MKKSAKLKLHRETLRDLNEREKVEAEGGGFPPKDPDPMTHETMCITRQFTCTYA